MYQNLIYIIVINIMCILFLYSLFVSYCMYFIHFSIHLFYLLIYFYVLFINFSILFINFSIHLFYLLIIIYLLISPFIYFIERYRLNRFPEN